MKTRVRFTVLLFMSMVAASAHASVPSLVLETPGNPIKVGEMFAVNLRAKDLFNGTSSDDLLLAFGINLTVSPGADLSLAAKDINPLFFDDSGLLGLDLAGSAFPGLSSVDAIGDLWLATLHFQALTAGQTSIAIRSNLLDFNQGLIFLNQGNLAIDANLNLDIKAVPIPAAAWMFITGLVVFGAVSRRRIAIF